MARSRLHDAIVQGIAFRDEVAQAGRQGGVALHVRGARGALQGVVLALLLRLGLGELAFLDGAADEKPGCKIEQARRQAHALGGVEDIGGSGEALGLGPAGAFEVGGCPLNEGHALLEDEVELFRRLEPLTERDGHVSRCEGAFDARPVAHDLF